MIESRQLPAPQQFVIRSIRAALLGHDGEILSLCSHSRFYRGVELRLLIAQKPYAELPLWKFADPATFLPFSDLQIFSPEERVELIRVLRRPLDPQPMIQTQEPFHVELNFDMSLRWNGRQAPAGIVVVLEGILGRAVQ